MTSYPSYPELSPGITPDLSRPLPIGEDRSGVQLTAELSQGELKAKQPEAQSRSLVDLVRVESLGGAT
jgi:hypothetical protein